MWLDYDEIAKRGIINLSTNEINFYYIWDLDKHVDKDAMLYQLQNRNIVNNKEEMFLLKQNPIIHKFYQITEENKGTKRATIIYHVTNKDFDKKESYINIIAVESYKAVIDKSFKQLFNTPYVLYIPENNKFFPLGTLELGGIQ